MVFSGIPTLVFQIEEGRRWSPFFGFRLLGCALEFLTWYMITVRNLFLGLGGVSPRALDSTKMTLKGVWDMESLLCL
jgi:hypothetical protein